MTADSSERFVLLNRLAEEFVGRYRSPRVPGRPSGGAARPPTTSRRSAWPSGLANAAAGSRRSWCCTARL
jgi:hypothetical protein